MNEVELVKKSSSINTYFLYSITFLLLLPIVYFPFILEGKSFVWHIDGLYQHYPILQHYGRLLRGALTGDGFPMVDYQLGLGFDTITTLHYYALGDPIALLTIFMTPENGPVIYNGMVLLRLYLAGISYILFCGCFGKKGLPVSLGALLYTFCGYGLFAGPRHPYFLNPMIYLPLILLGLERILQKKKPYLLILMIFISTISNFYFFYMLSVIAVIYVIFRYCYVYSKREKKVLWGLFVTGFRTGVPYLLGVAMASFVFIPMVYAFMQNGRMNSKPELAVGWLHYDKEYYISLVQAMFVPGVKAGYWILFSFSSVAIVSIAILFSNKKYRQLQLVFLLCFGGLMIPGFGYLMNGFAYLANRWVFLISFLIALTFTFTYERLFHLEWKEVLLLSGFLILYGGFAFYLPSEQTVKYEFFIILVVIAFVLFAQSRWCSSRALQSLMIYGLVVFTLGFNGYLLYSDRYINYASQFIDQDKVNSYSKAGGLSMIAEIKDNSFYRIESYGDTILNDSVRTGFREAAAYYSVMSGNITTYFKDLELLNQRSAFRFDDLERRTILDELENVKYFVTTRKNAAPFGYQLIRQITKEKVNYYLYENQYFLPLGYCYSTYLPEEEYQKLSPLEKQSTLLRAVILKEDNAYADKLDSNTQLGVEKLDFKLRPDKNVLIKDGRILIKKEGAKLVLEFKSNPGTETYIRFGNLRIGGSEDKVITFKVKGKKSAAEKVVVRNKYNAYYFGQKNYLVNLGFCKNGETKATITFKALDTIYYDKLEVYSLDMNYYKEQAAVLGSNVLREVTLGRNTVQGEIDLKQQGIMVFSIPYSIGWKAYVDGKSADLLEGNIKNLALPLPEGKHQILLKYETPYLRLGCLVSVIAVLIFVSVILYNKGYNRRTK